MCAERSTTWRQLAKALAFSLGLVVVGNASAEPDAPAEHIERASYIVKAQDLKSARYAVIRAGGAIANDLRAIHAVNAILTEAQRRQVATEPGVQVLENSRIAALKP